MHSKLTRSWLTHHANKSSRWAEYKEDAQLSQRDRSAGCVI